MQCFAFKQAERTAFIKGVVVGSEIDLLGCTTAQFDSL